MKRCFVLVLTLLMALTAAGCTADRIPEGERPAASEPAKEPDASPTADDPTQPAEQPIYALGTSVAFDPEETVVDLLARLRADGGVYQVVTEFSAAELDSKAAAVYAYESFPQLTGEEPEEGASREDGSALYVDAHQPEEYAIDRKLVTDPAVIAAFDDAVSGLEFTAEAPEGCDTFLNIDENACYVNVDPEGNETVYVFSSKHDRVGKADGETIAEFSAAPIKTELREFLYAVSLVYSAGAVEQAPIVFNTGEGYRIDVAVDGNETVLRGEEASGFTALFTGGGNRFDCLTRINCGVGDHGSAVLSFSFRNDEFELTSAEYTLYEDGRLVSVSPVPQRYSFLDHDQTIEFITLERCSVSKEAFDINTVLDYLKGAGE